MRRADRAELGDGHLEIGEHLEQEGLERLVGAVELVDQQHRRPGGIGLERLQQRTADQEAVGEDLALDARARRMGRLGHADLEHLARVVPLIDRRRDVETLVALQADQPATEGGGQHLGDLGLADARLALEEERPVELEGQQDRGREAAVGDVLAGGEQPDGILDGRGEGVASDGIHGHIPNGAAL